MAGANSRQAWIGGSAAAGPAGWRAARVVKCGFAARDAIVAVGRKPERRRGCCGDAGPRNLVGTAVSVGREDPRSAGGNASWVSLDCRAAQLRGGDLSKAGNSGVNG